MFSIEYCKLFVTIFDAKWSVNALDLPVHPCCTGFILIPSVSRVSQSKISEANRTIAPRPKITGPA